MKGPDRLQPEQPVIMSRRPIDLTPGQRGVIERGIAGFVAGESHEDCRKAAANAHALPLVLDWTACMAIRPEGEVLWIDYDEPHQVRAVEDDRERNVGLFQGSLRYPDLRFLAPSRPANAIDCPHCGGTGSITFPSGQEHLAGTILCYCGGLGWLPGKSGNIGLRVLEWLRRGRERSRT